MIPFTTTVALPSLYSSCFYTVNSRIPLKLLCVTLGDFHALRDLYEPLQGEIRLGQQMLLRSFISQPAHQPVPKSLTWMRVKLTVRGKSPELSFIFCYCFSNSRLYASLANSQWENILHLATRVG